MTLIFYGLFYSYYDLFNNKMSKWRRISHSSVIISIQIIPLLLKCFELHYIAIIKIQECVFPKCFHENIFTFVENIRQESCC